MVYVFDQGRRVCQGNACVTDQYDAIFLSQFRCSGSQRNRVFHVLASAEIFLREMNNRTVCNVKWFEHRAVGLYSCVNTERWDCTAV